MGQAEGRAGREITVGRQNAPGARAQPFAHALFPQSEMAQDALDDLPVVYKRDDAHFP